MPRSLIATGKVSAFIFIREYCIFNNVLSDPAVQSSICYPSNFKTKFFRPYE